MRKKRSGEVEEQPTFKVKNHWSDEMTLFDSAI